MSTEHATKHDVEMLKLALDSRRALLEHHFEMLELKLTARLGLMLIVGFGLTIVGLRLGA
jgi:hypothetical protein